MDEEEVEHLPSPDKDFWDRSKPVTRGELIDLLEALEARLETGEQHMAELTMSYMELNATVEALLNQIYKDKDSPEAVLYRETVAKIKGAMYNWMEHAGQQMATGGDSLNEAVLRLVRDGWAPDGTATGDPDPGDGAASPPGE